MTPVEILDELGRVHVLLIAEQELDGLLKEARLVRQRDTFVSGLIRVLEYHGSIIVQEYTDKNEAALRKGASIEAAERFVEDRLRVYEKMWDGCGCKIDYHK
jgi:hypothetical protein